MTRVEEIKSDGRKASLLITSNGIKKISEKTSPTDDSLMELDDILTRIIHEGREQQMIKLLKEYLEEINCKPK